MSSQGMISIEKEVKERLVSGQGTLPETAGKFLSKAKEESCEGFGLLHPLHLTVTYETIYLIPF